MIKQFDKLVDLMMAFPNEQAAIDHFRFIRWRDGAFCPHCNSEKVYHFADGKSHKCGDCRKRFSIKVGTIFEDSKIPLVKWFMAIWMLTSHRKGIASTQLARDISVTQKTAWFMLHRLRCAAQTKSFNKPLSGTVEADETYVGGKEKNKHESKKLHAGRGAVGKTPVLGVKQRDGEVRFEKAEGLTGATAMSFDEALGRYVQTDPDETLTVQNEDIPESTIDSLIDAFEACAQKTADGIEYWQARDLQKLFDYAKWEKFEQVIGKAKTACFESDQATEDHFVEVFPQVGKNPQGGRPSKDFMLSRYACYLTAQNGDARKKSVAFAQTYFAIQTRKQEIAERDQGVAMPLSEDEQRVFIRNQLKEHNKYLASAAKGAGVVTPEQFSIFHSKGYQGLYGKNVPEIRRYKGLAKSAPILDRMGSTELAANFFRVTQTEEKLRKENVQGVQAAYSTHYEVGRQVRDAMLKISGVAPEDLPAVESIKKAEKRLKAAPPVAVIELEPSIEDDSVIEDVAPELQEVDLRKDLWKYALLIMVQRPNMEISTSDLIAELPNYIRIPDGADANNSSRGDSKFSQIVRNLKAHKDSATNFIRLGYAEGIPRGFRATEQGRAFVLKFFEGRV